MDLVAARGGQPVRAANRFGAEDFEPGRPARLRGSPKRPSVVQLRTKWYRVVSCDTIDGMAMTLRLNEEQTARLREAAARDGLSMQAAALKAVDEYINRRTARRDALLAQILTEDAEVLKRLADS
jgi:predicted transcriptional regulator